MTLRESGLIPKRSRRSMASVRRIVAMPVMDTSSVIDSVAAIVVIVVGIETIVAASLRVVVVGREEASAPVIVAVVVAKIVMAILRTDEQMQMDTSYINDATGSVVVARITVKAAREADRRE